MTKQTLVPQTFSEYFNLNKKQEELDFLDIYANQDMPLFLDPYGISAMGSKWSSQCESQIASYFQFLLDSIRAKDKKTIKQLLNALHEVNEVSLGYSSNNPTGRGIGFKQAQEIQEAFEQSEAAKSGDIKDIADCALLIPGINRDKISDITANILKKQLIEFTQKQCKIHSIPLKKVPVSNAFDYDNFSFISYYAELPVINNNPKILLPISSVRHVPELSKDKYYRNFILEYLRAEHSHAGDSLATVLKNGAIKVRIGDLKKAYPITTNFLYEFSKNHPHILSKYKSELRRTANKKTTPILKVQDKNLTPDERIQILKNIPSGNGNATDFHKISFDNLIYIFGKQLSNPNSEVKINNGRKRIDIVFNNSDKQGFFYQLNNLHHVQCPKIFIECKNYSNDIGNPEIDQLLGRLSNRRGNFGILICRKIFNEKLLLQTCRDALHDKQVYITYLIDEDIFKLIKLKEEHNAVALDDFMSAKIDNLIL